MITGTAQIVGKTDDIHVEVKLDMSIGEIRAIVTELQGVSVWPVNEFRRVLFEVLHQTVDRIDRAQSVSS